MACAPSKNRHRATNALVRAFGEENGDGGGWAQLEVHALHSPFFAPTSKVERYPGHIGVASHGVMVGFTQFHHLVVVGGAEGMERLGQGSGRRRRGAGTPQRSPLSSPKHSDTRIHGKRGGFPEGLDRGSQISCTKSGSNRHGTPPRI